jgi:hypothetical protein
MNHAIVLAMLPLPLLAWASWPQEQEQPLVVMAVQSEGVRAQRQDTETFTSRWRPVYLAPMRNELRAIGAPVAGPRGEASASANRDDDLMFAPATYHVEPVPVEAARSPPPARLVRRAALRVNGICAKHGQRKVTYTVRGYQHWRCRR